jgi:hypothetical protein
MRHLGGYLMAPEHPYWPKSLRAIGTDAPFEEAHQIVDSHEFVGKWANYLVSIPPELDTSKDPSPPVGQGGAGAIHEYLERAELAVHHL